MTPPRSPQSPQRGANQGDLARLAPPALASPLARDVLATIADVLEAHPDLAARLRALLAPPAAASHLGGPAPANMSVQDYAAHAKVCERTIRYDLLRMTEGAHFRRDGAKGRRVIIHVAEADAWRRERSTAIVGRQLAEDLATNTVLQHRARAALRRVRSR